MRDAAEPAPLVRAGEGWRQGVRSRGRAMHRRNPGPEPNPCHARFQVSSTFCRPNFETLPAEPGLRLAGCVSARRRHSFISQASSSRASSKLSGSMRFALVGARRHALAMATSNATTRSRPRPRHIVSLAEVAHDVPPGYASGPQDVLHRETVGFKCQAPDARHEHQDRRPDRQDAKQCQEQSETDPAVRVPGRHEHGPGEAHRQAEAQSERNELAAPLDVQRDRPGKAGEDGLGLGHVGWRQGVISGARDLRPCDAPGGPSAT